MWKKLFYRSSGPTSGDSSHNLHSPQSNDEKVYWENPWEGGVYNQISDKLENGSQFPKDFFTKPRKQLLENQNSLPGLRRSRSLSSAASQGGILGERNLMSSCDLIRSPGGSNNNIRYHSSEYPVRCVSHVPAKQSKAGRSGGGITQRAYTLEKPDSPCASHDSSGNSSYSSGALSLKCKSDRLSHVSDKILDLYIDGEQRGNDDSRPKNNKNPFSKETRSGRRPPRVQSIASPTGSSKEKSRSNLSREVKDIHVPPGSRDWMKSELEPESPQKLAKNVVERLSQVYPQKPKTKSREFYPDSPTTVEDIFEEHSDPQHLSNLDEVPRRSFQFDGTCRTLNGYGEGTSCFQKQSHFLGDVHGGVHSIQMEDDADLELHIKAKEAEEKVVRLTEQLEQDTIIQEGGFTLSELFHTMRSLAEEKRSLAFDVSAQLQCRIAERASAKEAVRLARLEFDSRTRRVEREKNELQLGLEKELDRRSNDWSFKLGKYQSEEQRLRERVRELAEQNVSLQIEVSSFNEREIESKSRITNIESELQDLTERQQAATVENDDLKQKLLELQENFRGAEVDRVCLQRSYKEKGKENRALQKIVTRLQRISSEQDKTITGLRQGLSEEIGRKDSLDKYDNQINKMQSEQVRLTGVEQNLRKEVESYRLEVESLRHENINLLGRLKDSGNDSGFSSFKLDQELHCRIDCLQNQGLSLFDESISLCRKLLEFFQKSTGQNFDAFSGAEHIEEAKRNGVDGYFLVESNMKVQLFKRGVENLRRSLSTISLVLHEKSKPGPAESHSWSNDDEALEGLKLKSETLLTSVLKEKLLSKQLEVEQLQAELASAIRGHDILRCEVQGALDTLSCVSHKMKDLELQMLKKDENIKQLKSELQDSAKELSITNSILPKVSEERDLMWEEVKQYSEKNMLLNSEVNLLRKKVESLDENILVKEGILNDEETSEGSEVEGGEPFTPSGCAQEKSTCTSRGGEWFSPRHLTPFAGFLAM